MSEMREFYHKGYILLHTPLKNSLNRAKLKSLESVFHQFYHYLIRFITHYTVKKWWGARPKQKVSAIKKNGIVYIATEMYLWQYYSEFLDKTHSRGVMMACYNVSGYTTEYTSPPLAMSILLKSGLSKTSLLSETFVCYTATQRLQWNLCYWFCAQCCYVCVCVKEKVVRIWIPTYSAAHYGCILCLACSHFLSHPQKKNGFLSFSPSLLLTAVGFWTQIFKPSALTNALLECTDLV